MDAPLIRYATTSDGFSIAYWAIGEGLPLVVLPALPHSHIKMEWDIPEWRRSFQLGSRASTSVRYDARGTGLSQREGADFFMDSMLADLEAVLDALGTEKVALYGPANAAPIAVTYAALHPERVDALVLWSPVMDTSIHKANPMLNAARTIIETDWMTFSETVAHGLVGWSESDSARKYAELIREGIDQHRMVELVDQMHTYDVWNLLPQLQCKTLVMHRPGFALLAPGMVEKVAAMIPNARLALFEGASSAPYIGDWRAIAKAMDEFLGKPLARSTGPVGRGALRLLNMKAESLSPRELDVTRLVVQGLTNRQIAAELVLAEKTVENHIGRILTKLDLRSRTQLAAYAVEHGLTNRSA